MSSKESRTSAEPLVLREMIRAAAEDKAPDLCWDRIEARIFAELDDSPLSAPHSSVPTSAVHDRNADDADEAASTVEQTKEVAATTLDDAEQEVASFAIPSTREASLLPDAPSTLPVRPAVEAEPARPRVAQGARVSASRWTRWAALAAVAAAFGLLWVSHGKLTTETRAPVAVAEPIDPSTIPAAPGMDASTHDIGALKPGDVVEAAVGPVAFGQQGTMEWTLAAGGRLVVHEALQSGTHVVELESGSLRGSVAPGASMPLVISAGDTEVVSLGAGSIFSVTRSSRRVVMHLEEGLASVGMRGHRSEGRVFSAPLVAAFSLDGGSTVELIPSETASIEPVLQVVSKPAQEPSDPVSVPSIDESPKATAPRARSDRDATSNPPSVTASKEPIASADETPAPGVVDPKTDARLSDSAVSSTLLSCIARVRNERQAKAADGVSILVNSTLTVQVHDDGSVKSAVFNPPLERELQGCAVFVLRSKLQPGARALSVPISLP